MNNLNVVLDTTYVLPLFGIEPSLGKKYITEIEKMWENKFQGINFFLPDVCLIEVLYKLNLEFRKRNDPKIMERYSLVLPSIQTSKAVTLIETFKNQTITEYALKIREAGHPDLFDCLIGASALGDDILITEDQPLKDKIISLGFDKGSKMFNWREFSKFIDQSS